MYIDKILNEIEISEGVFRPDEGSIELAKAALLYTGRFLELGVGSGFISLVLYLNGFPGDSCDISPTAIECARRNFEHYNLNSKPILSDLYKNINGKYDLIIFNPPTNKNEKEIHRSIKNTIKNKSPEIVSKFLSLLFQIVSTRRRRRFISSFVINTRQFLNDNGTLLLNVLNRDIGYLQKCNELFEVNIGATISSSTVLKIKYKS